MVGHKGVLVLVPDLYLQNRVDDFWLCVRWEIAGIAGLGLALLVPVIEWKLFQEAVKRLKA